MLDFMAVFLYNAIPKGKKNKCRKAQGEFKHKHPQQEDQDKTTFQLETRRVLTLIFN
jgi:hypothetical protein